MKVCTKCKIEKDESEFCKHDADKPTLRSNCRLCVSQAHKQYRKDNAETLNQKRRQHYKDNAAEIRKRARERKLSPRVKLVSKNFHLRANYGITIDQYKEMQEKYNHRCAICGKHQDNEHRYLAVDHCHATGEIRGLLCSMCNKGIGLLKDSTTICTNATRYLQTRLIEDYSI